MLIWHSKTQEAISVDPVTQGFSWDAWYAKNKARLSVKRAKRYREDPSYRAAALERSRHQRGVKKLHATMHGDPYSVPFSEAAQQLNVTVWVLREWRRKNYFPEPNHREGRLWFSHAQVQLLKSLQKFFFEHGSRMTESKRPALENVVELVFANWN